MNHLDLASRVAAAAASWGRGRICHGVGTSACATTPAGSGHGLKGVRFSRVGVGDRRRVRCVRCSELLLVARVVHRVAVARNARVARFVALLRLEGAVAFARQVGGHEVLVKSGPLTIYVVREHPAPGSSATGADACQGHDSPQAHPPQISGDSVATWPHAVTVSSPWSSMRYSTRFPHVASALPSTGADANHSHAAPHLLPSPPVWPKRGKRPSAPPARSNRKAMALIIDFLMLN